jgi:hypothetical protein
MKVWRRVPGAKDAIDVQRRVGKGNAEKKRDPSKRSLRDERTPIIAEPVNHPNEQRRYEDVKERLAADEDGIRWSNMYAVAPNGCRPLTRATRRSSVQPTPSATNVFSNAMLASNRLSSHRASTVPINPICENQRKF